jgi:lipoprotein-anchoring transpeptidase ErfK/SrfK
MVGSKYKGCVMHSYCRLAATAAVASMAATVSFSPASANPFEALFGPPRPQPAAPAYAYANPADDGTDELRAGFRRQIVDYRTSEAPGTIIVDTPNTYLYLVLPSGRAMRYGIGVGREGFTWSGVKTIERKAEWPDWTPPPEMIARQPYLPRFVAGGPSNPLGARAMYLSGSVYRIHGTNAPSTIGGRVSSGCIRMVNEDVIDLYSRVHVGTKVVVLPMISQQRAGTSGSSIY